MNSAVKRVRSQELSHQFDNVDSAKPAHTKHLSMLILRAARVQARRGYATAIGNENGYKIAASNFGQATASLSLVLKAGTRYETKPGVASILKGYAFKVRVMTISVLCCINTELVRPIKTGLHWELFGRQSCTEGY